MDHLKFANRGHSRLPAIARILVAAVLLWSAAATLLDSARLVSFIAALGFSGNASLLAALTVASESVLGVWLLVGWWPRGALVSAVLLLAGYTATVLFAWMALSVNECPCGVGGWSVPWAVGRNLALAILLILGLSRLGSRSDAINAALAATGAGIIAYAVLAMFAMPVYRASPKTHTPNGLTPHPPVAARRATERDAAESSISAVELRVITSTRTPVAGASVVLAPIAPDSEKLEAVTDDRGAVRFAIPAGQYRVTVGHKDFQPLSRYVALASTASTDIVVEPAAALRGRVVDRFDRPMSAEVRLVTGVRTSDAPEEWISTESGTDGAFAFAGLREFQYARLEARTSAGEVGAALVDGRTKRDVVVRVEPTARLRVYLRGFSAPEPGNPGPVVVAQGTSAAKVPVAQGGTVSPLPPLFLLSPDGDGSYAASLLLGEYELFVLDWRHALERRRLQVSGDITVELEPKPTEVLAASLRTGGRPLPLEAEALLLPDALSEYGPSVELYVATCMSCPGACSQSKAGTLTLPDAEGYAVYVRAEGFIPVAVRKYSTLSRPLTIDLVSSEGSPVAVSVTDEGGQAVSGAWIRSPEAAVQTDATGQATIPATRVGSMLTIEADGYLPARTVAPLVDAGPLKVTLVSAVRARVLTVSHDGTPVPRVALRIDAMSPGPGQPTPDPLTSVTVRTDEQGGADVLCATTRPTRVMTLPGEGELSGATSIETVSPGDTITVLLEKSATGEIVGRTEVVQGKGGESVAVVATPSGGGADHLWAGRAGEEFVLQGLAPGEWKVCAKTLGGSHVSDTTVVSVSETSTELTLVLLPMASASNDTKARVTVQCAPGSTATGAWITVAGWGCAPLRPNAEGNFEQSVPVDGPTMVWLYNAEQSSAYLWSGSVATSGLKLTATLSPVRGWHLEDVDLDRKLIVATGTGSQLFARKARDLPRGGDSNLRLLLPAGTYLAEQPGGVQVKAWRATVEGAR